MYEDVYYHPEKFGLTLVGEIEWDDEPYQFNLTAVWTVNGVYFYWADDSGCSCPSPFESYTSIDKLEKGTKHEAAKALQDRLNNFKPGGAESWHADYLPKNIDDDVAALIGKIMNWKDKS